MKNHTKWWHFPGTNYELEISFSPNRWGQGVTSRFLENGRELMYTSPKTYNGYSEEEIKDMELERLGQ